MIRSALFFTVALAATLDVCAAERKPNIVLIMADDFGYECVGANGGNYDTPHLDRLAATGRRFKHCYVQPVCTPTRVQLMTGLSNKRNYYVFGELDPKAITFAHLLKDAGYATAIAGKWQLGREADSPQHFGFDEAYLWQHTRRPPRYANPGLEYNGEESNFTNGEYGPDIINDFAIDFVTRHKDEPFLLYYPMLLTHGPFQPTPDSDNWDPTLQGEKEQDKVTHFADNVEYADKLVGRLVDKLSELGIRENTLILFLGDNGTAGRVTSQFAGQPYKGGKGKTNAHGTHVPLIANWTNRIQAGQVDENLVSSTDFLPTLCEAAGISVPAHTTADGHSFLPQLLGQTSEPRDVLYAWFGSGPSLSRVREYAMTTAHKLYRNGDFYDLRSDPEELRPRKLADLDAEEAQIAAKLAKVLDQYKDARPTEVVLAAEAAESKRLERQQKRRNQRKQRATEVLDSQQS
jgi:arylsulfatase A